MSQPGGHELDGLETCDRKVLEIVRSDAVCRQLMTAPGLGPIVSPSYRTAMNEPAQFARSRDIGVVFRRTPKRDRSGEIDRSGRINKVGDGSVRAVLYESSTSRGLAWLTFCAVRPVGSISS